MSDEKYEFYKTDVVMAKLLGELTAANKRIEKLTAALSGVIAVADRKTKEFDAAREALAADKEEVK